MTLQTAPSDPALSAAREFLARPGRLLIDGEWREAQQGGRFEAHDPATGEVLIEAAEGTAADVGDAVAAARAAFAPGSAWRALSPSDRSALLWRIGELIHRHADELAVLESLDAGKLIASARGGDVALAADIFRYMAGWPTKLTGETIPISSVAAPGGRFHAYTRREPVGVVGQIIPWNSPLLMAAWKLAPALAAGCTVVLKPAELAPCSALRLGELILEADLPPGVVNIVTGTGVAGAALADHPDVDKVAFTGSSATGRSVVEAAARTNLKKVSLELGGKSPNIVFDDADLERALPGSADAVFGNQGQACDAGSRLFVQSGVYEEFVSRLAGFAEQMRVGPGIDPESELGPLISDGQRQRVLGFVADGRAAGAETLTGGSPHGDRGFFVEPTVVVGTRPEMRIEREEVFGPVVVAIPFDDEDDLVVRANDSLYGLAAGVWTAQGGRAHRVAAALRTGTVWVNCYRIFDAALPFGGYRQSGWGREMGAEVLENYLETKAVVVDLTT